MLSDVVVGERYRNAKTGKVYRVIEIAMHSETKELMVVYARTTMTDRTVWVRPIELFREKFEEV